MINDPWLIMFVAYFSGWALCLWVERKKIRDEMDANMFGPTLTAIITGAVFLAYPIPLTLRAYDQIRLLLKK